MGDRYRWTKADEVVPPQARTAAYIDGDGNLVIRQAPPGYGEDAVVVIAEQNRRDFVTKLIEIVKAAEVATNQAATQPDVRSRSGKDSLKLVPPAER